MNLIARGPLRSLLRSRFFPRLLQAATVCALFGIVALGWRQYPPARSYGLLYEQSEIVNFLLWGLWWPLLIWIIVLFGRLWCSVCPLEMIAAGGARLGAMAGLRPGRRGPWLQAGWVLFASYFTVQALHAGSYQLRVPHYTALFLITLVGLALLVGTRYQDRTFCHAFCPAALTLSLYGRGAVLAVRPTGGKSAPVPASQPAVCPSGLDPLHLTANTDCLMCGQCIKALGPEKVGLILQPPFPPSDPRPPHASWPATLFVMTTCGFVAKRLFCQTPHAVEQAFLWPINWAVGTFGASWRGLASVTWLLLMFPLLLWLLLGTLTWIVGGASGLRDAWRRLALPAIVIMAGADMAKAMYKVSSRARFLPHVLDDPHGWVTTSAIGNGQMAMPVSWMSLTTIALVSCGLVVLALVFGVREARLAAPTSYLRRCPALLLFAALFLGPLLLMAWQG